MGQEVVAVAGTVWMGTLRVGLLSLGVRLHSAREQHGPTLHQFVRDTGRRVRNRRVDEETGEDVDAGDIVKGALVGYDEYVLLEPEEIAALVPGRSRAMDVERFVPADAVDPVWYASAYFLSPKDRTAARPYRLLCEAMERTGRVAQATMVMRDREHLVLVGPQQGVLAANTLFWPDEIRAPSDVMPPVPEATISERDMGLAEHLVEVMAKDWTPEEHEDVYTQRLQELIEAKAAGRTVSYGPPPGPTGEVRDITDALRRTLEAHAGGRAPAPRTGYPTKKELLERARELDVPGRSKMSREELEEAIERASA
jgi:DNA end-binding protein Ku